MQSLLELYEKILLPHSVQWRHTPYFSLQIHTNSTVSWSVKLDWSIFLKHHQVDSVIKDFWQQDKLIKLCSI